MAGTTADRKTNRNKLVECEKGPKFKNEGITWLGTAQVGYSERQCTLDQTERCPRLG